MTAHRAHPGQSLDEWVATLPDGAVLELDAGTYPANLIFNKSITLRGVGEVVLDGEHRAPIVRINPGRKSVRLEHLTLTHGGGPGAALDSGGMADVELVGVTVLENDAGRDAAIQVSAGTLLVERCRLTGNRGGFGAAIFVDGVARATLRGSLVVGNHAIESTIAIRELGQLVVEHSTLADNAAPIAIEVRATADRRPTLRVFASIVSHHGIALHNGPPLAGRATVERSVVDGETSGEVVSEHVVTNVRFVGEAAEPYRPKAGTAATALIEPCDARDLTGVAFGTTAGALAPEDPRSSIRPGHPVASEPVD